MKLIILVCLLIHTISAVDWIPGRGAKVAFIDVEAEHAKHTGKVIGNDRHYGVLSSEASGRRAVTLDGVGQYVEFTTPIEANSIVVRFSIPDTASGKDQQVRKAPIDLYVGGQKLKTLTLTSAFSHYYGGYPFNNQPGSGSHHHFYDEVRTLFDKAYPAGTKVKLQVTSTSESPTFTIDVVDFELVGKPGKQPAGSISVLDYKADPTGKSDSRDAFQKAVDAGKQQRKIVWVPQGTYLLYDHVIVDNVELHGAGPWYTVLTGRHPTVRSQAVGIYGKWAKDGGSKNVVIRDLAIIGDIHERQDDFQTNAIGGALSNTLIENVWMQHTKCGCWMDGPMNNLTILNCRITDTNADGVNFHIGVTNSRVENTFLRNNGDDSLAMWGQDIVNANNKFVHNTIGIPVLANNVAIYGGRDIEVSDNLIYDTITNGGGIHIANRYPGVNGDKGVSGTHKVYRNTLLRAGNSDYNWQFGVGAIWFSGENEPITRATIHVKDVDIIDSSYEAIHFIQGSTNGVIFENVFINGTGTFALQIQVEAEATFDNVRAINIRAGNPIHSCGTPVKFTRKGTNTGWFTDKPFCNDDHGSWPEPKWPWNW